ncbi:acyltransferase domain-containing protein [Streptomyces sp. FXJ1.172]|uniref:acyltransferase domain-containing protein n=1 Tax=Streptomyces sp. FXJ1.172 TaxID=710705 RepID=UPI0007CFF70D|nr:acyltransferase domain-containing protein [Streptomyces sp. FXJ1.172]WEO93775.1 acyltransferase domain-containing protein [Streptomyces sp. FXJ1.172]
MLPDGRTGRTAFLFSADAPPRPGTGRELRAEFPVFAEALDDICARLDPYLELPLGCVMSAADGTRTAALLDRAPFAGPALFALQAAQYRLLRSWGIRPDVVYGQAAGRMAAAYAAGVFSLAEACHAVGTLARLLGALPDPAPGCPGMDGILGAYGRTLATLHPRAPRLPLVCDVTPCPVGTETAEPEFWVRRAPLPFADTAGVLHRDGVRTWLELGPGDLLVRLLPGCLPDRTHSVFALSRDWAALRAKPDEDPGSGGGQG